MLFPHPLYALNSDVNTFHLLEVIGKFSKILFCSFQIQSQQRTYLQQAEQPPDQQHSQQQFQPGQLHICTQFKQIDVSLELYHSEVTKAKDMRPFNDTEKGMPVTLVDLIQVLFRRERKSYVIATHRKPPDYSVKQVITSVSLINCFCFKEYHLIGKIINSFKC